MAFIVTDLEAKYRSHNVTESTTSHKRVLWVLVYMANSIVIQLALLSLYKAFLWDNSYLTSIFTYSSLNQKLRDTALFIKVIFNGFLVLFSVCGLNTVISLTADSFK